MNAFCIHFIQNRKENVLDVLFHQMVCVSKLLSQIYCKLFKKSALCSNSEDCIGCRCPNCIYLRKNSVVGKWELNNAR